MTKTTMKKQQPATVSVVAAGPGNASLVTVRAMEALANAAHIITDATVQHIAREYARDDAEITVAAEKSGQPLPQADITRLVADAAKTGAPTVRLLAGDPVFDGTLLTEVNGLRRSKLNFEVIPGISEITGVPAYAGFGLTGGKVHDVHVVDATAKDINYAALVEPARTLVFRHGADHVAAITAGLLRAGMAEDTPIAITRDGTTVDQRTMVSTIGEAAAVTKATKFGGPGIVVVGDVIDQREKLNWFETKALVGWRILIPRTQDNTAEVMSLLRGHGAVPLEVPTISVEPPRTPQQMDRAIHGLVSGRFEWIGFTSVNAVRAIREKLVEYGLDARSFAGLKVAAVGDQAIEALIEFGVRPDLVPSGEPTTSALLEEWPAYDSLTDPINRVFLPRADIATDTLAAGLAELGWEVEDITAYRTVRAAPPAADIRESIKTGGFDAVLFTSSSTVRNLVGIAGKPHHTTVVACIGPQTAKTAEEHGLRVDVMPSTSTVLALVDALAAHGEELRAAAIEAGEVSWRPSRKRPPSRRKTT